MSGSLTNIPTLTPWGQAVRTEVSNHRATLSSCSSLPSGRTAEKANRTTPTPAATATALGVAVQKRVRDHSSNFSAAWVKRTNCTAGTKGLTDLMVHTQGSTAAHHNRNPGSCRTVVARAPAATPINTRMGTNLTSLSAQQHASAKQCTSNQA